MRYLHGLTLGFLCKFFSYELQPYIFAVYATLKLNGCFLGWKNLFEERFAKKKKKEKNILPTLFFA